MDVEKCHPESQSVTVKSSTVEDNIYVSWDGPEYVATSVYTYCPNL